jgi:hypothetical protein
VRGGGDAPVLLDVLLDQPGDIGLVGQDIAGDARAQEQGDQAGDAAPELEDARGGG